MSDNPSELLKTFDWQSSRLQISYLAAWCLFEVSDRVILSTDGNAQGAQMAIMPPSGQMHVFIRLADEALDVPLGDDATPLDALIELSTQMEADFIGKATVNEFGNHSGAFLYAGSEETQVLHLAVEVRLGRVVFVSALTRANELSQWEAALFDLAGRLKHLRKGGGSS